MTDKQTIQVCNAKPSIQCDYKRNAKPATKIMACGYEGPCIHRGELNVV